MDDDVYREGVDATGAVLMGRKMFSGGAGPWEDDPNAMGWWGDEPPFGVPVFILTHHAREPVEMQGGTTFTFVTDGVDAALAQARAAAEDKNVAIAGGADVAQQYLRAGLVDEVQIHLAPLLLGDGGVRLFDGLGSELPHAAGDSRDRVAARHAYPLPRRALSQAARGRASRYSRKYSGRTRRKRAHSSISARRRRSARRDSAERRRSGRDTVEHLGEGRDLETARRDVDVLDLAHELRERDAERLIRDEHRASVAVAADGHCLQRTRRVTWSPDVSVRADCPHRARQILSGAVAPFSVDGHCLEQTRPVPGHQAWLCGHERRGATAWPRSTAASAPQGRRTSPPGRTSTPSRFCSRT